MFGLKNGPPRPLPLVFPPPRLVKSALRVANETLIGFPENSLPENRKGVSIAN